MDGVIIQTERIYRDLPVAAAMLFIVLLGAVLTWFLLNTIRFYKKNKGKRVLAVCLLIAMIISCVVLSGLTLRRTMIIHNDLIVTIDDSVSFNEFNKNYKIVSRDGNLYTVRMLETEVTEAEDE